MIAAGYKIDYYVYWWEYAGTITINNPVNSEMWASEYDKVILVLRTDVLNDSSNKTCLHIIPFD